MRIARRVTGARGHILVDKMKHADYLSAMTEIQAIDARGLLCPLPVLKLRKRMKPLDVGDEITLWADDPAAVVDVPHFCAEAGHTLLSMDEAEGYQVYQLRKG
ncbi:MAG: sulfurtransferase TusA family protein [Roseovarius sp.]